MTVCLIQWCKTIPYCRGKCGTHILKIKLEAYFKAEHCLSALALEPMWEITHYLGHRVSVTLGYLCLHNDGLPQFM